jgi:flagellar biosynthetic protein FliP
MKKISFKKNITVVLLGIIAAITLIATPLVAQSSPSGLNIDLNSFINPPGFSTTLNLLLSMGSIAFIPFFVISTTSFIRIVIVMSMTRTALATQQAPPNMVIVSLALFMTVFIMTPTWEEINRVAIQPYREGKLNQLEMFEEGIKPLRLFMLKQTRDKDLALFVEFSQIQNPQGYENIPTTVIIPAFMISELKTAFQIGFLLYIPFVVIDLIISNILLSLGMFMLSPAMISAPFKILLFVLADGWNLIVKGLILSFQ